MSTGAAFPLAVQRALWIPLALFPLGFVVPKGLFVCIAAVVGELVAVPVAAFLLMQNSAYRTRGNFTLTLVASLLLLPAMLLLFVFLSGARIHF
jgi:hypothetical protein